MDEGGLSKVRGEKCAGGVLEKWAKRGVLEKFTVSVFAWRIRAVCERCAGSGRGARRHR